MEGSIAATVISIIKPPLGMRFLYVISYDTTKGAHSSQSKGLMQGWNKPPATGILFSSDRNLLLD